MPLFEEEINQVDFAALLVGGGVVLEDTGNADGVFEVLLGGIAFLLPNLSYPGPCEAKAPALYPIPRPKTSGKSMLA